MRNVLIANRGEIAARIARACRARGLGVVAVYSDADAGAAYVAEADRAVRIGPPPSAESYLSVTALLDAARVAGADAVHPGYGFLSENAAFAQAVLDAGLTWIGPPPSAIAAMGDKAAARRHVAASGVPVLPGYDGDDPLDAAPALGLPLLVKAVAGGGGRGLRVVRELGELPAALASARSEAASAFGRGDVLLERYVERGRHVEIQVLADAYGAVRHLGERDCSVQRRHQKVVEEAPAVGPALRAAIGDAAVAAARSVGYVGAGTVEFLLEPDGRFWFLEMNTRLQVEHPVTEAVWGVDLVDAQLAIADGAALSSVPMAEAPSGHAIEVRLYAEDPAAGFLPQSGTVAAWTPPSGVRVEAAVRAGDAVSPFYDPMIAKLIAWGRNREEARRKLIAALRDAPVLGLRTNGAWLAGMLDAPDFVAGAVHTGWLESTYEAPTADPALRALAALFLAIPDPTRAPRWTRGAPRWTVLTDAGPATVAFDGAWTVELDVRRRFDQVEATWRGAARAITFAIDGGPRQRGWVWRGTDTAQVEAGGSVFLRELDPLARAAEVGSDGVVRAPMAGRVVTVVAQPGETVPAGAPLVTLEAMKLEHRLVAPVAGAVREVRVRAGDQVRTRDVLVVIDPA